MVDTRGQQQQDRTPPHSNDAEQATLGAMMIGPSQEAIGAVCEIIPNSRCYYAPAHRKIFDACVDLHDQDKPADITTVAEYLERAGHLDDVGGRTYLAELARGVATAANAGYYAQIVFEKFQLRELITISTETVGQCYRQEEDVDDLLDEAEGKLFGISDRRIREDFALIGSEFGNVISDIGELHDRGGGLIGLSTGFKDLDDITAGFRKEDLIIIAGRPSMGKSSLSMDTTKNAVEIFNNDQLCKIAEIRKEHEGRDLSDAAEKEIKALTDSQICAALFSLEMGRQSLAHRALCGASRVNSRQAERGLIDEEEYRRLQESAAKLNNLPIYIDGSPTLTPIQMRGKLRRLAARHKIGLIVVDYMQLMDSDRRADNRQQEISTISRRLKAIAKEYRIPLIAVSQLSRAVESRGGSKRPQLSDLRESGAIEQDADVVAFVYRPEYYLQDLSDTDEKKIEAIGKAEIIIAKQRCGPTGSVWLHFNKELAKFSNLARGERQQEVIQKDGSPF